MSNGNASVQTGPPLEPDQEAAHKLQLAEAYADQADAEVEVIEAKLAGWQQALKDKKAEAKRLRAEADKGAEG
jgi:chromosome condensin MukBEF ATPase and DNA-binding subunit MukB